MKLTTHDLCAVFQSVPLRSHTSKEMSRIYKIQTFYRLRSLPPRPLTKFGVDEYNTMKKWASKERAKKERLKPAHSCQVKKDNKRKFPLFVHAPTGSAAGTRGKGGESLSASARRAMRETARASASPGVMLAPEIVRMRQADADIKKNSLIVSMRGHLEAISKVPKLPDIVRAMIDEALGVTNLALKEVYGK